MDDIKRLEEKIENLELTLAAQELTAAAQGDLITQLLNRLVLLAERHLALREDCKKLAQDTGEHIRRLNSEVEVLAETCIRHEAELEGTTVQAILDKSEDDNGPKGHLN